MIEVLCNSKPRFYGSEIDTRDSDVTVAMQKDFCCLFDRVEKLTSSNDFRQQDLRQLKYLLTAW